MQFYCQAVFIPGVKSVRDEAMKKGKKCAEKGKEKLRSCYGLADRGLRSWIFKLRRCSLILFLFVCLRLLPSFPPTPTCVKYGYQQQLPPSVQWEWQAPFILCPNEPQGLGFSTLRRSFQKYAQSPFERDTCIFLPAIPQPYPRPSFYAGKRQDRNKKHVGQGKQWYGLEERPASPFLRLFCTRSTRPPCRKAASSSTTYHIHQGDDSFALVNYGNNASISTTKKGTHDTTTAEQRAEDDQRLSTLGKRRKFSFLRAHVCAVRAHTFVKK